MLRDAWIAVALTWAGLTAAYVLYALGWLAHYYWRKWWSDRSVQKIVNVEDWRRQMARRRGDPIVEHKRRSWQ